MPYKKISSEDGGIIFEAFGVFTDNDLDQLCMEWSQDEEVIRKLPYVLLDTSDVEVVNISSKQIEQNAKRDREAFNINPKIRLAIYSKNDLIFGLGRMWGMYACELYDHEKQCMVSRSRDDVLRWLRSDVP